MLGLFGSLYPTPGLFTVSFSIETAGNLTTGVPPTTLKISPGVYPVPATPLLLATWFLRFLASALIVFVTKFCTLAGVLILNALLETFALFEASKYCWSTCGKFTAACS